LNIFEHFEPGWTFFDQFCHFIFRVFDPDCRDERDGRIQALSQVRQNLRSQWKGNNKSFFCKGKHIESLTLLSQ
jgi:hypothetical protein